MALLAGEVIHIIKCVPIEVKRAQTQECYQLLGVQISSVRFFVHLFQNKMNEQIN